MKITSSSRVVRVWLLCAALWCGAPSSAQQPQPQPQPQQPQSAPSRPAQEAQQEEDVLRVSTNLVQTDVTVLDKQGRFAEGLRREDFELKVDGKPQPLLFFERVAAGGTEEARRIAAARGETAPAAPTSAARGRSVIFFVDDAHLSRQGMQRARQLLNKIIDEELTPDTQALVASPSGRVGFLQQFTNEKAVLRAAVARLAADVRGGLDAERPPMSYYQAIQIDRGDRDMLEYFITQTVNQSLGIPGNLAEIQVKSRARRLRRQAALLSAGVLGALESVATAPAPSPGRRLLYFLSEGFTLDTEGADSFRQFQRVVDAAARSGTVIYTLDTRGLAVGMLDASSSASPDLMSENPASATRGFVGYSPTAELSATQDVLRSLAADTGGRALLNTNGLEAALSKTLAETADYYLLAWRPEGVEADERGAPRFRKIEVSVRNRPDLKARVRRGVFAGRPPAANAGALAKRDAPAAAPAASQPAAVLNHELNATAPAHALPVELYAVPANEAPGEATLTAFVQVDGGRIEYFKDANGRKVAEVETAIVVLDDRGKPVHSTGRRLTLDGSSAGGAPSPANARVALLTSFNVPALPPGIYQVRVAARDQRSRLVGGARQWVEVPDLKSRRLTLDGLVLAESRAAVAAGNGAAAGTQNAAAPRPSADRVFARTSKMLVQLYIYNAATGAGGAASPDLEMSLRVLDRGKEVLGAPPHKVSTAGASDPSRVRYAAEIPLRSLAPGAYLLEVVVTDRDARTTAARQLAFAVE